MTRPTLSALLDSHPVRVPANSGIPHRAFCGAGCGRQMLPGEEWRIFGLRERICGECACWARRVKHGDFPNVLAWMVEEGQVPAIPEGM